MRRSIVARRWACLFIYHLPRLKTICTYINITNIIINKLEISSSSRFIYFKEVKQDTLYINIQQIYKIKFQNEKLKDENEIMFKN